MPKYVDFEIVFIYILLFQVVYSRSVQISVLVKIHTNFNCKNMKVKVILRKLSSGKQVFQMRFTDEDNKKRYRTLKDCPIKVEDWKRGNKDHRANYLKKVNKKSSIMKDLLG